MGGGIAAAHPVAPLYLIFKGQSSHAVPRKEDNTHRHSKCTIKGSPLLRLLPGLYALFAEPGGKL